MKSAAKLIGIAVLALNLVLAANPADAGSPEINLGYFNKLAMNGYDVMTYWKGGDPQEGDPDIAYEYRGATWVFVSKENRETFAANPVAYAPSYGGYCAYAASLGELADVDPFSWRIYKDRLYMNYSPQIRRTWANKIDANIEKADALWPGPLSKD